MTSQTLVTHILDSCIQLPSVLFALQGDSFVSVCRHVCPEKNIHVRVIYSFRKQLLNTPTSNGIWNMPIGPSSPRLLLRKIEKAKPVKWLYAPSVSKRWLCYTMQCPRWSRALQGKSLVPERRWRFGQWSIPSVLRSCHWLLVTKTKSERHRIIPSSAK